MSKDAFKRREPSDGKLSRSVLRGLGASNRVRLPYSRISYSRQVLPLHDDDLTRFIVAELAAVGLGANTFDEAALQVVLRAVQGNLRLCRNLCYASLIATCLDHQRICTVAHVNAALLQPHWRSHDALLKQQVKPQRVSS